MIIYANGIKVKRENEVDNQYFLVITVYRFVCITQIFILQNITIITIIRRVRLLFYKTKYRL